MVRTPESFNFEYTPTEIVYGRGSVGKLGVTLDDLGAERALVVCGSNVGANQDVMGPIEDALGTRLAGVFDETTPDKYLETVIDGVERVRADDIDVVVAVGGGSSMNVARAMCSTAPTDLSRENVVDEVVETRQIPLDSVDPIPNVAIPTTMAGADVSSGGSVFVGADKLAPESVGSGRTDVRISDPRLMSESIFYDPVLFATTPTGVLASSAMNGFDKGIETLYSRTTNPIGNAHSVKGLQHYCAGLPDIIDADSDDPAMEHAVVGTFLVQYGRQTNIIHTFGNGISLHYDIQQGAVHGIVAPHVLRYVFDTADSHRHQIAEGLTIDTDGLNDDEIADAIIAEVTRIRDALGLPSELRSVEGLKRDHFPNVAEEILDNHKHERNPPGVDPTAQEIVSVLEAAW